MENSVLKIACFTLFICNFASSGVLQVGKCKLEDSACILPAVQKAFPTFMGGIPEIGTEVLDVLEMDFVKFDLAGLKFSLKDGRLKGLKNAVVDIATFDMNKKEFTVDFHLDCVLSGHYTASGKVLILPIDGDGQFTLTLKKMRLKLVISYEIENREGKDYIAPKKVDFEFEVIENANFKLTNLFNGNKDLSDGMHAFLNEQWPEVSKEFGKPLVQACAKKIYKNVVKFFKNQPLEEIAIY